MALEAERRGSLFLLIEDIVTIAACEQVVAGIRAEGQRAVADIGAERGAVAGLAASGGGGKDLVGSAGLPGRLTSMA